MRGSGRVLAFVFIASVIWLLFDMAALRLSINDVNSQLLKERVIKEREIMKQQSRVTQGMKRGFKHPVQRVDFAVTQVGKGPLSSSIKLAQVYRYGGKKQDQTLGDKKSFHHRGGNLPKTDRPKTVQRVTPKQDVPAKKQAVNLDLNVTKIEKSSSIKVTLPVVVPNITQVPPGVQDKHAPLPTSKIAPNKSGDLGLQNALDSKTNVKDEPKIKTGTKVSQPEETHPVKTTPKPPNKDVKGQEVNSKTKVTSSDLKAAKETLKPTIKLQAGEDKPTAVKKPAGVHKILSLDVTNAPRDAKAVGQFGQAALVASSEDAEVKKRWNEGHFNVYLSDQIPVDRAIPDTRPET